MYRNRVGRGGYSNDLHCNCRNNLRPMIVLLLCFSSMAAKEPRETPHLREQTAYISVAHDITCKRNNARGAGARRMGRPGRRRQREPGRIYCIWGVCMPGRQDASRPRLGGGSGPHSERHHSAWGTVAGRGGPWGTVGNGQPSQGVSLRHCVIPVIHCQGVITSIHFVQAEKKPFKMRKKIFEIIK